MERETKKKEGGEVTGDVSASTSTTSVEQQKKKRGIISRIWNGLFRVHGDDFQKRLEHISREEATVLARMKRRSQNWRRTSRHIIIFSVIFEAIAVGYAIMTTRSMDLNWKMRALRVLPMFLLPCLSSLTYSALLSFTRMFDRKDQKTLERLRAERQAKIDELKEKTNYYTTQQLIQRYDSDPAAKAAAASVLASKLGADSGLKVYVGDESKLNGVIGKSHDVELVQSSGLRNRKQVHSRSSSAENNLLQHSEEEMLQHSVSPNELVVENYHQTRTGTREGGWLARVAALLVGEDPTQSYALICGNCHMHNGLARWEDFPYITYYCPRCSALNRPKQLDEHVSRPSTPIMCPSTAVSDISMTKNNSDYAVDRASPSGSPVAGPVETTEESKTTLPGDSIS